MMPLNRRWLWPASESKFLQHPVHCVLQYEELALKPSDILVPDSDDELNLSERATKRRRIEKIGQNYLEGRSLVIQSAALRGTFNVEQPNPWSKSWRLEWEAHRETEALDRPLAPHSSGKHEHKTKNIVSRTIPARPGYGKHDTAVSKVPNIALRSAVEEEAVTRRPSKRKTAALRLGQGHRSEILPPERKPGRTGYMDERVSKKPQPRHALASAAVVNSREDHPRSSATKTSSTGWLNSRTRPSRTPEVSSGNASEERSQAYESPSMYDTPSKVPRSRKASHEPPSRPQSRRKLYDIRLDRHQLETAGDSATGSYNTAPAYLKYAESPVPVYATQELANEQTTNNGTIQQPNFVPSTINGSMDDFIVGPVLGFTSVNKPSNPPMAPLHPPKAASKKSTKVRKTPARQKKGAAVTAKLRASDKENNADPCHVDTADALIEVGIQNAKLPSWAAPRNNASVEYEMNPGTQSMPAATKTRRKSKPTTGGVRRQRKSATVRDHNTAVEGEGTEDEVMPDFMGNWVVQVTAKPRKGTRKAAQASQRMSQMTKIPEKPLAVSNADNNGTTKASLTKNAQPTEAVPHKPKHPLLATSHISSSPFVYRKILKAGVVDAVKNNGPLSEPVRENGVPRNMTLKSTLYEPSDYQQDQQSQLPRTGPTADIGDSEVERIKPAVPLLDLSFSNLSSLAMNFDLIERHTNSILPASERRKSKHELKKAMRASGAIFEHDPQQLPSSPLLPVDTEALSPQSPEPPLPPRPECADEDVRRTLAPPQSVSRNDDLPVDFDTQAAMLEAQRALCEDLGTSGKPVPEAAEDKAASSVASITPFKQFNAQMPVAESQSLLPSTQALFDGFQGFSTVKKSKPKTKKRASFVSTPSKNGRASDEFTDLKISAAENVNDYLDPMVRTDRTETRANKVQAEETGAMLSRSSESINDNTSFADRSIQPSVRSARKLAGDSIPSPTNMLRSQEANNLPTPYMSSFQNAQAPLHSITHSQVSSISSRSIVHASSIGHPPNAISTTTKPRTCLSKAEPVTASWSHSSTGGRETASDFQAAQRLSDDRQLNSQVNDAITELDVWGSQHMVMSRV
ncbi:hypothetical protein LTR66_011124 [Elasticomyces elasticus]|nr:hypothetical protein LTR66_011124 [Elasticomyces elasticus]